MKTVVNQNALCYSLVTYLGIDEIEEVITKKIRQIDFCCVSPYHDKDLKEDGITPKEPHYHVIVKLYERRSLGSVRSWFKIDDRNTLGQAVKNTVKAYEYFFHKNDPTKYQYNECDIKVLTGSLDEYFAFETDFDVVEKNLAIANCSSIGDDCFSMLNDIIEGVSYSDLARRYGRDLIKNFNSYQKFAYLVAVEESRDTSNLKLCYDEHIQSMRRYYHDEAISTAKLTSSHALRMVLEGIHIAPSTTSTICCLFDVALKTGCIDFDDLLNLKGD